MHSLITTRLLARLGIVAAGCFLIAGCAGMAGDSNMAAQPDSSASMATASGSGMQMANYNRYGGPAYLGKPALPVTVALIQAGGGAGNFSLVTALNHMLGHKTVKAEVAKLTQQYGAERVHDWINAINFYVHDTLQIVKAKGIALPAPADLSGTELARALVKAGTAPDGTFWAGRLFDVAVSHPIHIQLMNDADAQYGGMWDANAHKVTNQAFYDVAQALGMTNVKLAPFH